MDRRLKKWIGWIETIHDEVQNLLVSKDIFWSTQELLRDNPNLPKGNAIYRYLGDTYVSHAMAGIRRQVKFDDKSISFARLLTEMAEHPECLTRDYYRVLYEGSVVSDLADSDFDKYCDAPEDRHISAASVQKDLDDLKITLAQCESFADRRVAHRDLRPPKPLKFSDIDEAIASLDSLYCRYHLMLKADNLVTLMPTYQYDWLAVFDVPWRH